MNGNWILDPRLRHAGTEGGKEAVLFFREDFYGGVCVV